VSGPVEELCSRHNYPDALRDVLTTLVDASERAYPKLVSFVLSGSAATGDYVWRERNGTVELVSDLDMMLFADKDGSHPELLDAAIAQIKGQHPGALFQVDIATSPPAALDAIAPSFQMVETGRSGAVLAGEDVLARYPDTFDGRTARRSFLGNLWKPFLYWSPPGGPNDMIYQQVCARFFLDVPLLAFAAQGRCVAGHRARAQEYLKSPKRDGLYCEALRERVAWAIGARSHPSDQREGLEAAVAHFAFLVVSALDGQGTPPEDPSPALAKRLALWLPRRSGRRIAGELRSALRKPTMPLRDLQWVVARKEATGGAALLGLLAFLATEIGGQLSGETVPGVGARLGEYSRQPALRRKQGESTLAFVYRCKRAYRLGLSTLYPSLEKKEPGVEDFLQTPPSG
jgi:hypothetical protein